MKSVGFGERVYRFPTLTVVPVKRAALFFFKVLGPKLQKKLGALERGGAQEKRVSAVVPTLIHEMIIPTGNLFLDKPEQIPYYLGTWAQRTEGLLGDRTFVVPPVHIIHNTNTETTTISFFYERWNAAGMLQYPHNYN